MKNYTKIREGFTVIELIVAVAVFIVLLGMIVNIFIGSLRTQRSLVALMTANDNVSLVLEQMAREIRTATSFDILGSSLSFGRVLKLTNASNQTVSYRLNPDPNNPALERGNCTSGGCDSESDYNYLPITSNNVKISRLTFGLVHEFLGLAGDWPPRITIVMRVTSKQANLADVIFTDIQTTVSGRNLDFTTPPVIIGP